jgi:hypothetical protein
VLTDFLEKKKTIWLLLGALFVFFAVLSFSSDWSYGDADDIVHYRFARYAFVYPHLLLDHWAKPLFTLLSSPFAQFGFAGMRMFNLLIGFVTALFVLQICKLLHIRNGLISVLLMFFAPVYLSMLVSGMTEILFGFVLLLSVYLVLKQQYAWAAIALSFIVFVRNEGCVFFPFFVVYFLLNKKFWQILLFSTGFWLYSFVGSFYYHDFWWVITKMPYTGAKDIYGSGSLFHFITQSGAIFGLSLTAMFAVSVCFILRKWYSLRKESDSVYSKLLWLMVGPAFAYLGAHSVLWWQGWGGSFGLTRVMAGIAPIVAIVAWFVADRFLQQLLSEKVKLILIGVLLCVVIPAPFYIFKFPVPLGREQQVMKQAALWVQENGMISKPVYFYNHYFYFTLGLNPFDSNEAVEGIPHRESPAKDIKPGSLVVWDAHFSANDGRLPKESLMNDSLMQLVRVFKPNPEFTVFDKWNYEVCLFRRLKEKEDIQNNYKTYVKQTNIVRLQGL